MDSSIANFTILKKFDIQIHLRSPLKTNDVLWHPPPNGWIKCNIDGLSKGKPMVSACGGIFRNDHVLHVGSFFCSLGYGTALFVEFGAALFSLEKANERHWNHIWIESDSSLVVQDFSNHCLVPWRLKVIWMNCIPFTQNIDFMVSHIYREGSACADNLANSGLTLNSFTWFNFVHTKTEKYYLLDKRGTPRLRLLY